MINNFYMGRNRIIFILSEPYETKHSLKKVDCLIVTKEREAYISPIVYNMLFSGSWKRIKEYASHVLGAAGDVQLSKEQKVDFIKGLFEGFYES